ncbi:MAG TPA: hypothetical protein DCP31_18630, partial [Cyanobacteria bacterium UBA8543]|nr:hypothetical protein [Cyanobacteria bacterium UBA8543]
LRSNGTQRSVLSRHSDMVEDVSFSPDGKIIASASRDQTIKLWNLEGTLLHTLHGADVIKADNFVLGVSFSPDSKIMASANDGTVTLWNLDLNNLLKRSCAQLNNYLQYSSNLLNDKHHLCRP